MVRTMMIYDDDEKEVDGNDHDDYDIHDDDDTCNWKRMEWKIHFSCV
jgi:hypothetical protein